MSNTSVKVGLGPLALAEHTNNTHTADRANKKMTSGLMLRYRVSLCLVQNGGTDC